MIQAVNQPIAYLYCITNILDGMQYIGVSKTPKRRFKSHAEQRKTSKSYVRYAMHKHGIDNFKMDILVKGTQEYCYLMEAKAIQSFNTLAPHGYNFSTGGRGGFGLTGEKNGAYGRTGAAHPMYGKRPANADRPVTTETRAKMSASRTGLKRTEEMKERMRQIALSRSPELKEKMRLARIAAIERKKELI